jgi:hypothetical protein
MRGGKAPARRVDAYLFAKTWRLFDTGREVDAHQLADILEISMRTSWLWLRTLHEMRCIHVVGWKKDTIGRDQTPIYLGGDGFDKPKSKSARRRIGAGSITSGKHF